MKILIVNPNSSKSMTDALVPQVEAMNLSNVHLSYYTSKNGPPSINDYATIHASCAALLADEEFLDLVSSQQAVIIACYSPHDDLIESLHSRFHIPVVGIFEASIAIALASLPPKSMFCIASTGDVWQDIFKTAVPKFLGTSSSSAFLGTATTGLTALETHEKDPQEVNDRLIKGIVQLVSNRPAKVLILGCAAMTGLGQVASHAASLAGIPDMLILDPVKCAVSIIIAQSMSIA